MRLFVSVQVPPFEVPGLDPSRSGEVRHLTLKFLGDVPDERVGELGRELERALRGATAFPVVVHGLGVFPSPARPRVLWAGVREGREGLEDLARRVEGGLAPLGFPSEGRPFVAHVTLRRLPPGARSGAVRSLLELHAETSFGAGTVGSVELQKSELLPGGARHTVLLSVPLGPALT